MAKKKTETATMLETFSEFKETKNIDRATLQGVLEESFRNVIAKIFGTDENFDVVVNPDKGDFEIWRSREVVADEDLVDDNKQIALSVVNADDDDFEVGEDYTEKIEFEKFGRRAILTLRQTLASKILELEHDALYNQYKEREGEIIAAEVYQTWKNEALLIDEDNNELMLPKSQQIPRDFFHKGDTVRAIIDHVDNSNGNPKIFLSRTSNLFLQRLMEQEIPEIADGIIRLQGVARIPGERAKVAVESFDDRVDPVGACVGVKGSRIHGIVKELHNESIDVINYSANKAIFIQRALAPARILRMDIDEDNARADVFLEPDQVSMAIGKGGLNIKLASMLTGFTIDVFRDMPQNQDDIEDIYLDEFNDEVDQWVIDAIKQAGYETAREVLAAKREVLIEKADLEEDTVDHFINVLKKEFEDDEIEDDELDNDESHEEDTAQEEAVEDNTQS
ncbi:MAG: transcription termination factor NusA [Bacteroidaceae bacterium]|nr:transcription termination factor NusA [Bacteroidaceae bacterium]